MPLSLFLRSSSPREILSRFLRNLKAVYSHQDRWERLLSIQERLVILLPSEIDEIRDRGLALAQLDYIRPAMEDLLLYLEKNPDATLMELAEIFKCSFQAIDKWCNKLNITRKKNHTIRRTQRGKKTSI